MKVEKIGGDIMKISTKGRYALRVMIDIAINSNGDYVSVKDIATIVRCLYNRSKVKELPILERKLYESAKKLLEDEISYALGKTSKEIEAEIHTKLEPWGAPLKVKHIVPLEDDEEDDGLMDDINKSDKSDDSDDDSEDDTDDMDNSSDDLNSDEEEDFDDEF